MIHGRTQRTGTWICLHFVKRKVFTQLLMDNAIYIIFIYIHICTYSMYMWVWCLSMCTLGMLEQVMQHHANFKCDIY